jgi:hypothetical protein
VPPGAPVASPHHVQPHLADRAVSGAYHDWDGVAALPGHPFEYLLLPRDRGGALPPHEGYAPVDEGEAYALLRRIDR